MTSKETVIVDQLAIQLGKSLADQATRENWMNWTSKVIPVPSYACVPGSPHVTAWLIGISIRFVGSPVLVDWN